MYKAAWTLLMLYYRLCPCCENNTWDQLCQFVLSKLSQTDWKGSLHCLWGDFFPKVFSSSSLPPWEVGTWKMNKREGRDLPMSRLTPFCLSKGRISAGPPLRLLTVHIPPAGQENGLQTTAGPVVGHTHLQTRTPTLSCPPIRARRTTPCAWLSWKEIE